MTSRTVTITNSVPIPKTLQAQWKNKQAVLQATGDFIILKRIEPTAWKTVISKFRKAGKRLPKNVVADAVAWARAH